MGVIVVALCRVEGKCSVDLRIVSRARQGVWRLWLSTYSFYIDRLASREED